MGTGDVRAPSSSPSSNSGAEMRQGQLQGTIMGESGVKPVKWLTQFTKGSESSWVVVGPTGHRGEPRGRGMNSGVIHGMAY
jgi:hypothetical protein